MAIEVHAENRTWTVASTDELNEVLDGLVSTFGQVLVGLLAHTTALTIGVGQPDVSVALYLDRDRRPWFAHSRSPSPEPRQLVFHQNGVRREFNGHTAISSEEARAAAHEFLAADGARPVGLSWQEEGGRRLTAL